MSSRRTGVRPVDQGVALASGDEPAIHRIGNSPGDDECNRQAARTVDRRGPLPSRQGSRGRSRCRRSPSSRSDRSESVNHEPPSRQCATKRPPTGLPSGVHPRHPVVGRWRDSGSEVVRACRDADNHHRANDTRVGPPPKAGKSSVGHEPPPDDGPALAVASPAGSVARRRSGSRSRRSPLRLEGPQPVWRPRRRP